MPPAALQAGPELAIQLDNVGPSQPGSLLTGRVVRTAAGVSPRATVSIRLLGRAKAKMVVTRHGQTTTVSYYRNRFPFFEPTETRALLLDAPLHIAAGAAPASWPFAVAVPRRPSPRALVSEGGHAGACYLPLRADAVAASTLPASFGTKGRDHNATFEAYVEYQLEATLVTSGSHGKDVTAVLPVPICAEPMRHPLSDFDMHRRSLQGSVSTYRLVPGMEQAKLSFKQKTTQLLGSSKVPLFGYTLHVDCPAVLPLGHPTPIPFSMRIVPDKARTSETIHDVEQTVTLPSLEMVLKCHTHVIAPGTFRLQAAHDTVKHSMSLPVVSLGQRINPPVATEAPRNAKGGEAQSPATTPPPPRQHQETYGLLLPSKWQAGDESALDIGAAIDFRLFPTHAAALDRAITRTALGWPITPAFETYCIQHHHTLKWKAVLEIAGKPVKHESEQTVAIVGPSEQPPPSPFPAAVPKAAKGLETLPPYEASARPGGPSNRPGTPEAPVNALPSYST